MWTAFTSGVSIVAKKKTEKPKMPALAEIEVEIKTKPVRLDLSLDMHAKLRVVAARHGKPMAVFARQVVEQTVLDQYREGK